MQVPPSHELLDFDAFACVMSGAPLDDLHKYIDSDDEQDLEDNYEGNSEDEHDDYAWERSDKGQSQHRGYPCIDRDMDIDSDADLDNISDASSDTISDSGTPYKWIDERLDVDHSLLPPSHAASHYLDPHLQQTIDRTESLLEQLSTEAQRFVDEQPLSTQIIFSNQATDMVLKPYGKHGSQARFSESVMRYLSDGHIVRRHGKDGADKSKDRRLRFAVLDPNKHHRTRDYRNLKRKPSTELLTAAGSVKARQKLPDKKGDIAKAPGNRTKEQNFHGAHLNTSANVFGEWSKLGWMPPTFDSTKEPQEVAGALSFRKTSGPHDFLNEVMGSTTRKSSASSTEAVDIGSKLDKEPVPGMAFYTPKEQDSYLSFPDTFASWKDANADDNNNISLTPLATIFSEVHLKTPTTSRFRSGNLPTTHSTDSIQATHTPISNYSCSLSPPHNQRLAREPYNPISLKFTWPATLRASGAPSMPTPGLLDSLNRIVHFHNAEARFLLSYYVRKYDTPAYLGGPGGRSAMDEPPHALFRLGIAQHVMSKVGKIVEHKERDELGLNPEARRILGQVWEAHPSTNTRFDDNFCGNEQPQGFSNDNNGSNELDDMVWVTDTPNGAVLSYPSSQRQTQHSTTKNEKDSGVRGGLNPLEKLILARACSVSVETVDAYWDDMREKTKAWAAMKLWCRARDAKRIARVKSEGRW